MDLLHGITVTEIQQKAKAVSNSTNGVAVVVGKAPIHLAKNLPTLKPVIVKNIDEFKQTFGFSEDYGKYSLCEAAETFFELYKVSPVIFINVVDPAVHYTQITNVSKSINNGSVVISDGAFMDSLVIRVTVASEPLIKGTDYIVNLVNDEVQVTFISNAIGAATEIFASYKKIDISKVTEADVIGAYDVATGKRTGIEAIQDVFSTTGRILGQVIVPGYNSQNVVAALKGKISNINGLFKGQYLIDLNQTKATVYTSANTEKESIGAVDPFSIVLYGTVGYKGKKYHLSTHVAALKMSVDQGNNDLPFEGASNKSLIADSIYINGVEMSVDIPQANTLNSQGIGTAIRFGLDFLFWGNRTGISPKGVEAKENFIPVRSMFNYISNTLILEFWRKVDNPLNKRLIESFVDEFNLMLNSWTAYGAILGGTIEFRESDNPVDNLADGKIKFYLAAASPTPAEDISVELEYDINYLYQNINA